LLHELVLASLPAGVHAITLDLPPVAGAVIAAGAAPRFRETFRGWSPDG
jgi:hypothetical protein